MDTNKLQFDQKSLKIISNFKLENESVISFEKYGAGHINQTYLFSLENGKRYILQKINNNIFKDVDMLMGNIEKVTLFMKEIIIENNGDPNRETLNIVYAKDGKPYFYNKEDDFYYRIYEFVEGSVTLQECSNKELFKESAVGFGKFAKDLEKFDASKLGEVIKDFHNTEVRFAHFVETLKKDPCGRAKEVKEEIEFVLNREKECSTIVNLLKEGKIPLHVTHNDTKLNNVLMDAKTLKPLCVIDLDTVMPGSILYDFGDSIRFGCNPAGENERDLTKVNFKLDYFEAYVDGYLSTLKESISKIEKQYLSIGAKLMTLECGIRFLDDYIDGDHYFATKNPDDNLVRARTQFKLVSDMEKLMPEMERIIKKY